MDLRRCVAITILVTSTLPAVSCTRAGDIDTMITPRGNELAFDGTTWSTVVRAPFDVAWQAVVEVLDWQEWAIESRRRDSGSLRTATVSIGADGDRYACEQWDGDVTDMRCALSIRIVPLGQRQTEIHLIAMIEGHIFHERSGGFTDYSDWRPCLSTGKIEGDLVDGILARLKR